MKFIKGRKIARLALPITRLCNRACPECPARARIDTVGSGHIHLDELVWVGKTIGHMKKIEITGGEPSIHPRFAEISENIHRWLDADEIMLLTNGCLFDDDKALPLLTHYDRVYVSHYTDAFAARYGALPNTELVEKIRKFLAGHPKTAFWEQRMDRHDPMVPPPYKGKCPPHCRYDTGDMISYNRGQLYGCCVAWQLPYRGKGILLTADWREHLEEIELPCEQCFFTGSVSK